MRDHDHAPSPRKAEIRWRPFDHRGTQTRGQSAQYPSRPRLTESSSGEGSFSAWRRFPHFVGRRTDDSRSVNPRTWSDDRAHLLRESKILSAVSIMTNLVRRQGRKPGDERP